MSTIFYRQWLMLNQVPVHASGKGGIGSKDLELYLQTVGMPVSQRTIQRELVAFSKLYDGLQSDGNKDKAAWSWKEKGQLLDLPGMSPEIALSFQLTKQFLDQLLPGSVKDSLSNYYNKADKVLSGLSSDNNLSNWSNKVRIVPRNQPLLPAKISPDVLQKVYQALLEEKPINTMYQPRDSEPANYEMHPQGLVVRQSIIYLVATLWKYEDPRHFALHRISECEISDKTYHPLADFNLDTYIATGTFDYTQVKDKEFKLVAIFNSGAAFHLQETPLSDDQKIVAKHDGRDKVTATVKNSLQLRWWLLGFGEYVEIIKPKFLRDEFIETSQNLGKMYQSA